MVNDAAQAYSGVIPADCWHDPYMPKDELVDGVIFWMAEEEGRLLGVMGIQDRGVVALVRHAYVASAMQRKGVGTELLLRTYWSIPERQIEPSVVLADRRWMDQRAISADG